jgi:hypothetical protein
MPINQTPTIPLLVGGPSVKITVECREGPGGSQIDTTSVLGVAASAAPAIATIAVTGPREVTVTPGTSPGTLAMFVNETPGADKNLQVNVESTVPPSVREIVYISHV